MKRPFLPFCLALATIWLAGILIARHQRSQLPLTSASPNAVSSSSTASLLASSTALGAAEASTTPPSATTIAWQPSSLVVTLSPGETKTVTATATITSLVPASTLRFDSSLSPYITVTPSQLPALPKGGQQTFTLSVNVPATATLQTLTGALQIHLRSGDVLALNTLPITLNAWRRLTTPSGLKVMYPPDWVVTAQDNGVALTKPIPPAAVWEDNIGNTISFAVATVQPRSDSPPGPANPNQLPIDQWFAQYFGGGSRFPATPEITSLQVAGRPAIRVDIPEGSGVYTHVYIPDGPDVIELSFPLSSSFLSTCETMLGGVGF